jgi:hypothetical protein
MIPFKTQRKYQKLYEQYVLSLAKSSNKSEADLEQMFSKIFGAFTENVSQLEKTAGTNAQSLQIGNLAVLY